ncbi:MAG: cryptochrome/photolyase family protein [Acidimicrobiia bacterium]
MTQLAVFTRDLRIHDNPVLAAAGTQAVPLFVDPGTQAASSVSANQTAYLYESLASLDRSLSQVGSSLVFRTGDWVTEIARVADQAGATKVHVAADPTGVNRSDVDVMQQRLRVPVEVHQSRTVVEPGSISPGSADFYQRFSPYFDRWLTAPRRTQARTPVHLKPHDLQSNPIPPIPTEGTSPLRALGGEDIARDRFGDWLPHAVAYDLSRNQLATDGTSRISVALHFGELSALEVAEAAEEVGATEFARQIAWRDFNYQLLFHNPRLVSEGLRPQRMPNLPDGARLQAWRDGITGYPVVDAGMRQLRATGWMHNRARMLTASFLTKHLRQDWRAGADWFLTWLTDGDIANNQLGWQWVAGIGVDTNPWRMFNPTLQSHKYDPDGGYIRAWIDELSEVDDSEIHDPSADTRRRTGYPLKLVNHASAVARFKSDRNGPTHDFEASAPLDED